MKRRLASLSLIIILLLTNPVLARQTIYIDEGVDRVVILCEKKDFHKEAAEFRSFRQQYALLWTGIIAALVYYASTRVH